MGEEILPKEILPWCPTGRKERKDRPETAKKVLTSQENERENISKRSYAMMSYGKKEEKT